MTNFDIFLSEPEFASFAEVAALEENVVNIDKSILPFKSPRTKHIFCFTA